MRNRLFIGIILFSMTLHCLSRIGFLSYLYQQRHDIAYTLGLVAEIPIAMCNSDYDFSAGLVLHEDNQHDPVPTSIQASEIVLFVDKRDMQINFSPILLRNLSHLPFNETALGLSIAGIFQPPRA